MQANRRTGTGPERALASALHKRGLRFRRDLYWREPEGAVRTYIDIAFPARRVAVFCDGCTWHGCDCRVFTPKTNALYWAAKIARNVERDRRATAALTAHGWTVIRAWEHEDVHEAADRVDRVVRKLMAA